MPIKKQKTAPTEKRDDRGCHREPNYECVLREIASELGEIAQASRHGANELHFIRKSVQHIEKIFDQGGQIGRAMFTADPPIPKTQTKKG